MCVLTIVPFSFHVAAEDVVVPILKSNYRKVLLFVISDLHIDIELKCSQNHETTLQLCR